jgi:nitrogen fixation NifU-like protein
MDDLYRELIIDRYKNPQYRGHLDPHQIAFEDDNPLCGDHIRVELQVDENNIVQAAVFDGHGCAISQAAADLLMEKVEGQTLEEIRTYTRDDLLDLLGIELGPVRLKCALLSLKVLKAGVYGLGEATDDLVS